MTTSLCRVECRTLTCNLLTLCPHVRSRVYITVERPSVCLSARQSDRSTTAAACGGFAAGRSASRKYRNTTGAGAQQQRRRSTALTAANADSVALTAEGRGWTQTCCQTERTEMGVPTKEVCYGCRRPIEDRYLMRVMDQPWHERCVQCCVCLQALDRSCYIKDSQLYCKPDYERSAPARVLIIYFLHATW